MKHRSTTPGRARCPHRAAFAALSILLSAAGAFAATNTQPAPLTEARSNEIQALYAYNVALAVLDRVTGRTVKPTP